MAIILLNNNKQEITVKITLLYLCINKGYTGNIFTFNIKKLNVLFVFVMFYANPIYLLVYYPHFSFFQ